jgi:hypothetical protein
VQERIFSDPRTILWVDVRRERYRPNFGGSDELGLDQNGPRLKRSEVEGHAERVPVDGSLVK